MSTGSPVTRIVALLLAFSAFAVACTASRPLYTAPEGEKRQLLLWRTVHSGSGGTAYVLGSVHLGDGPIAFDPAITDALRAAPTLLVEVDPKRIEESGDELRAAARLPQKLSLQQVVSPDTYARVRSALRSFDLPENAMDLYAPWFVYVFLNLQAAESAGLLAVYGVDNQIIERARPTKRIQSLESVELQVALFAELQPSAFAHRRYKEQVAILEDTLDSLPDTPSAYRSLLEMWSMGDDDALGALLVRDLKSSPVMEDRYRRVITDRNVDMARRISERLALGEDLFVVVGAGHVIGSEGIPALLADRGYVVERVRPRRRDEARVEGPGADTFAMVHAQLMEAITERDGRRASGLVSRATIEEYDEALRHAVGSEGWVVKSLSPSQQIRVLLFRIDGITEPQAEDAGGAYAITVDQGWHEDANPEIEFHAPVVSGATAKVPVRLSDVPGTLVLGFRSEDGQWRIDFSGLESQLDTALVGAASDAGVDTSSLILEATAAMREVEPDPTLWEPRSQNRAP